MNQKFVCFMRKYLPNRIAVAVSGGVDSMCLLYWMHEIGIDIVCLHVNHGLRPSADIEAAYVAKTCNVLGIKYHEFNWTENKPKRGLESAARDARYKFMTDFCHENNIKYIATAHQADDQIETFLMNLARGSGVYGLAAMASESVRDGIKIIRPMLGITRSEIQRYCDDNGIKYFYDEMNCDPKYTRVKIRQNRHLLNEKLGISDARILLAIENLGRVRDAMSCELDIRVSGVIHDGYALFTESFLFDVDTGFRLKLLGTLIQKIGGDKYQPRLNSLQTALCNLTHDCKFTLGHCTIRRHGDKIIIVPEGAKTTFRKRNERHKKDKKSV